MPDRPRFEALKNARIQFWTCLNKDHRHVTWTGDVAACDTCGLTSEMTRSHDRVVIQVLAEHVLLIDRLKRGTRCPWCHGKPAVIPWPGGKDRQYRCGAGHAWSPPLLLEGWTGLDGLLEDAASTGEIPALPAGDDADG